MSQCPFSKPQDINFMDPVVQENWFEAYKVLHRDAPVYHMADLDMYIVTKYDDLDKVLKDPVGFPNDYSAEAQETLIQHPEAQALYHTEGWPRLMPLSTNLPEHRSFRALIDSYFTASAVRKREALVQARIDELVDDWIHKGEIEFIKEFAEPLPMAIIAEALGFPRVDLPRLKRWSAAWVKPWSRGLTLDEEKECVRTHIEFQHYIHETALEKRANPTDDVISHLATCDYDDPLTGETRKLTDAEVIGISDHLLTGGNETTTFALASGLWLLFRYPDIYAELKADRSKVRIFVEEALRIESPTQGLMRIAAEDTSLRGVEIPKGAVVHVRYGAGNRDPERYPDPDRPDLNRRASSAHLAFGIGEHICPGAALSRFEQNLAWNTLLDRLDNLRPVPDKDDYTHIPGFWLRALKQIHVRFDPAKA
ncbi:cytochrome P450 [Emcibacter sp. SYSU 3D8]|uniref:cytochrome P450 n=1 Tax=Emcibacter sp. SYSU 3D8 TaxID=3133969 RepID=UPI0031FE6DB6